jgi:polyhydroxyalkanoate synthesis regulator phasin
MAEEPINLVLEILRAVRASQTRIEEDSRDLQHRMSTLEQQVGVMIASEMSHYASVSMRLDRLTDRVERIERRLEIVPAT